MRMRWLGVHLVLWTFIGAAIVESGASCASADSFDWRNVNGTNWLTSVKNQFGGTCWDFAAVGAIEAKYMISRNDISYQPDLSEQQVNWETNPDMGDSVNGGNSYKVFDYCTNHGIVLESECPYDPNHPDTPGAGDPWPLAAGWQNRCFKSVSNYNTFSQGTDINYLKSALKTYGPMAFHLEADNDWYSPAPGNDRGGHMVVLVGYQDDSNAPGGGYWIVKNSWGDGWNGNGYGTIAYATRPSYSDWSWLGIYNRDVCGTTGPVYFTGSMATVTWQGGSTWTAGGTSWSGSDMYGNSLPTYAWENKETTAIFNTAGGSVSLSGKVIAHGLTINAGASGYVFNGINNGSFTVTAGGITANESVAINAPVTIGAPQTWSVASGKSLTIGGSVHTIISNLTINGAGDTTITGSIDGGMPYSWPGTITMAGTGTLHLTGSASYSVPFTLSSGYLSFEQNGSSVGNFSGVISGGGSGWISKSNSGTIILSGANTYNCWTRLYSGVVQADLGVGLPTSSSLILNGGTFQSNSAVTYTDSFRNETSGTNRWLSWWDGGFAGGGGKLTVNLRNNGSVVNWTGNGDTGIGNSMRFGSPTAQYEVEFKNAMNLNGAVRTIYIDDNPNSAGDFATMSGVIANGSATSGLIKTGPGLLKLTAVNTYGDGKGYDNGATTISQGALQADRGVGLSGNSGLILNGGVLQSNSAVTYTDNLYWQCGETGYSFSWANGGFSAGGGKMTVNVGGDQRTINFGDVDGRNGIMGTVILSSNSAQYETEVTNGLNLNGGARTIQVDDNPNSSGDFATLSGVLSDSVGGGSLTKTGKGTLYIKGAASNTYSGTTTFTGGTIYLAKTGGAVAIPGNVTINDGAARTYIVLNGSNQIASTAVFTSNTPIYWGDLELNGNQQTLAGISSDAWATISNSGVTDCTLTVNNSANYTFAGKLVNSINSATGKLALVKTGSGTLTLTGSSTFTGGTTVSAGLLAASGTAVPGTIAVNSGGAFSPGIAVGSAATGAATWNTGGKYVFEIDSATGTQGANWDLWNISGNLTDTGTFTISAITESSNGVAGQMPNFNNANSYQWLIATTTGTMPSDLVSLLTLSAGNFQNALGPSGRLFLSESSDYKSLYLNYSPTGGNGIRPVPEPGSFLLLITLGMTVGLAANFLKKGK